MEKSEHRASEKKLSSALFLSTFCLSFVVSHSSLFLSTLAFYRFYRHTHTHRIKSSHRRASSEREREKKRSSWGRKRYALFRFDIQQKKRKSRKKTFALREMMRKAHFFLTYTVPFRVGHPFFKRMTMCRASRTTTTTTTTTLCASLQRERVRQFSPS